MGLQTASPHLILYESRESSRVATISPPFWGHFGAILGGLVYLLTLGPPKMGPNPHTSLFLALDRNSRGFVDKALIAHKALH